MLEGIAYLRGYVRWCLCGMGNIPVVVLLNEVSVLEMEESIVLLSAIGDWLSRGNVNIICTGRETSIIEMFTPISNEYFKLKGV